MSGERIKDKTRKAIIADRACEIIEKGLAALNDPERLAEASPAQITTALGTLIDKWADIKSMDEKDKVKVIIDV